MDGYRVWSRTYDEPGNPLLDVDEPIVRAILSDLPPGDALDAVCGTMLSGTSRAAGRGRQFL